jgi:anti-sigma factor RsiW
VTLTCAELVEQVTAHLDGALEPDDDRRFMQHAGGCRGCSTYVDQYRETVRLVGSLPDDGVTASARADLLAAFRRRRGADRASC